MTDSESLKEQIRQRIDLVELVSEHVALRRTGKDFVGLCPFHSEKTPSFSVSPTKAIFKCFGCNAGGDVFTFMQLREGVTFPEAVRILAERAGIDYDRAGFAGKKRSGPDRNDLARVNAWAAGQFKACLRDEHVGESVRAYLAQRGLSEGIVDRFGLGLAVDESGWLLARARKAGIDPGLLLAAGLVQVGSGGDRYAVFRGRLMFPIRDTMNRVIGFGGRTLKNDRAKYLNTSQNMLFDKGRNVYGLDLARQQMTETRRVIVVEGYTDCMAAHQHGFVNTVATLGTALTDNHVALLRRWCDSIVLLFDSDEAGMKAADRAVGVALRYNVSVEIASVPEGKDPCEFLAQRGASGFDAVLSATQDAMAFRWRRTQERYASDESASGRKEAIREFVALVARMTQFRTVDAIQRGLIVNQIAKLLSLPGEEVHGLLVGEAQRARAMPSAAMRGDAKRPLSGPDDQSQDQPSEERQDAEQAALLAVLEILVNQPGLWSQAVDVFRPERFPVDRSRRVAQEVVGLLETVGAFEIPQLLDRFENPDDARFVTDLLVRGSRRGNFEATLAGSCHRLREIERARRATETAEQLRRIGGEPDKQTDEDQTDEDELLRRFSRDRAETHGFGARTVSSS